MESFHLQYTPLPVPVKRKVADRSSFGEGAFFCARRAFFVYFSAVRHLRQTLPGLRRPIGEPDHRFSTAVDRTRIAPQAGGPGNSFWQTVRASIASGLVNTGCLSTLRWRHPEAVLTGVEGMDIEDVLLGQDRGFAKHTASRRGSPKPLLTPGDVKARLARSASQRQR